MKKNQIRGIILLAAVLVAYLVLALVIPFKKEGGYWVGFAFGIIGLVVSAVGIIIAFKGESIKSKFYGFPIARIAVIYAIIQIIASFVLMGIGFLIPAWIGTIICIVLLIIAVIGFIATDATRDEIERQDEVQKINTENMISLRSKANALVGLCKDPQSKELVQKLSEEFRFSDPVSNDSIRDMERELDVMLGEIQQAILDNNKEAVEELCGQTKVMLAERNRVCKLGK